MTDHAPDNGGGAAANRRPIAARGTAAARRLTALLLRTPVTPNQISLASVAFAAVGAGAILAGPGEPALFLLAVAAIQLRLLCNLLDGMVAVEGGRHSPLGPLFNEFPDRVADSLLIVALGHAAGEPWLGWAGALAAALTAYVRAFGGALGQAQDFRGPMAKQHRMAVMSAGCLAAGVEPWLPGAGGALGRGALYGAALVIFVLACATCVTRAVAIAARLRHAGPPP